MQSPYGMEVVGGKFGYFPFKRDRKVFYFIALSFELRPTNASMTRNSPSLPIGCKGRDQR